MKILYASVILLTLSINTFNARAQAPASVLKKVIVPNGMNSTPFNTERYLKIPELFDIAVFVRISGARFIAVVPNGDVLVSVPGEGKVKIIRSAENGNPSVTDFVTGLNRPHDMVFHSIGDVMYLYISEEDKISRYIYSSGDLTGKGRQIIVSDLPSNSTPELKGKYNHALKNIAIDGNHKLYVSIASTCNACAEDNVSNPVRASVYIYNADGTNGRLFARGLRNAEGLDFIPGTNTLWVVVNNRDEIAYPFDDNTGNYGKILSWYVDNHPVEEFTQVEDGGNYGWPFCNPDSRMGIDDMPFVNDYQLNKTGSALNCDNINRINKGIQAHSAPLGFMFLQNTAFPVAYKNGAAIALHGSWNRTKKTGYKVIYFPWNTSTQKPGEQITLIDGFLNADSTSSFGRPVDVAVRSNGDLLVSDDQSGTIYALRYTGPTTGVYSPIGNRTLTIAPDPARDNVSIHYTSAVTGEAEVSVSDSQGKMVLTKTLQVVAGDNAYALNVQSLIPGIYIVRIKQGEALSTERLVIDR